MDRAETRLRETLGIVPTSRVKNTETILEKLRRAGGSGLKSIQDLAGMRIVREFDRRAQDELVEKLVACSETATAHRESSTGELSRCTATARST